MKKSWSELPVSDTVRVGSTRPMPQRAEPQRAEPARSDIITSEPLHGADADRAVPARLDTDLRPAPLTHRFGTTVRLADPVLEKALEATRAHVRRAAVAEGYAAGHAAGMQAGPARADKAAAATAAAAAQAAAVTGTKVDIALGALRAAADALEASVRPTLQGAEEVVLRTAVELAEALVGRELTFTAGGGQGPGLDAVGRALASMPGSAPVTVRLSPADMVALDLAKAAALPSAAGRRLEFVKDFSVERGGAIAECDAIWIDAQLGAAMARIRAVLDA